MVEYLDAENDNVKYVVVGPGWVNTKIHEQTLRAGGRAGENIDRIRGFLAAGGSGTPIQYIYDCINWLADAPKQLVGGRNFSVVSDTWGRRNGAAALADGARLPFASGKFDLLLQSTVLTSILDQGIKKNVADEMIRVLAPKGAILWYDFRYDNPRNPDVRGIGRKEIQGLFPHCRIRMQKTILLPPLARGLMTAGVDLLVYLLVGIPAALVSLG